MACFIYVELIVRILNGETKTEAYTNVQISVKQFFGTNNFDPKEVSLFDRILNGNIAQLPITDIQSSGYVLHSLEAAVWCFLRTSTYRAAVLDAVNLGSDTDTTAAIVGGLAGVYYGLDKIPPQWRSAIARGNEIEALAQQLCTQINVAT